MRGDLRTDFQLCARFENPPRLLISSSTAAMGIFGDNISACAPILTFGAIVASFMSCLEARLSTPPTTRERA